MRKQYQDTNQPKSTWRVIDVNAAVALDGVRALQHLCWLLSAAQRNARGQRIDVNIVAVHTACCGLATKLDLLKQLNQTLTTKQQDRDMPS